MQTLQVVAQRGTAPSIEVNFDMSENLAELSNQFTEELVYNHAKRSIIIALQGFMRSIMDQETEKGKSQAEIAQTVADAVTQWKPSQKKAAKTTAEKARDILSRLSPAERKALLKDYSSKKGGDEAHAA